MSAPGNRIIFEKVAQCNSLSDFLKTHPQLERKIIFIFLKNVDPAKTSQLEAVRQQSRQFTFSTDGSNSFIPMLTLCKRVNKDKVDNQTSYNYIKAVLIDSYYRRKNYL